MDPFWMKLGAALLLGMMILFLLPRAKQMMKESRTAESGEWLGAAVPIVAVVLFVLFLMSVV